MIVASWSQTSLSFEVCLSLYALFNFFVQCSSYKIVGLLNLAYDFKFSANSAKS